jgi:glycosyltransferase involved in cell wall biosynthesis
VSTTERPRIAFVIQRYGPEITGGSESLARAVAERLAAIFQITVFTSCARDYVTWRNELPAGVEQAGGIEVCRFPVEEERDLEAFNRLSDTLYDRPHSHEDEQQWLRRQGPYLPGLVASLRERKDEFEAVLFFTYLYFPTYWGLRAAPERAILVPTAHDEPPLRFSIYSEVFGRPRAFAFLTRPEEALVRSRFDIGTRPATVAALGVETPVNPDVEGVRIHHALHEPYVLYAGRIDAGKGCEELIAFYDRYRQLRARAAELILIGTLAMPEPRVPGVRYLGHLSENEKFAAMAGARAVVCSSPYESLSISLLEGLSLGTPGLVNARSPVLEDHCRRSNAGLYYRDADEFLEAVDLLVREPRLQAAMGENGRAYIRAHYSWETVLERWKQLIEAVAQSKPALPTPPP